MGEAISLTSARDGFRFGAYHAPVSDARRGGLVILHAIWGVTPHLRQLADSYAETGYEVIVPNLFERVQPGFRDHDTDQSLLDQQMSYGRASGWGVDLLDAVQAAIDALAPPVFAMGFCFGGTVAWLAASRCTGLAAVSCFYGSQVAQFLGDTPKVPLILHLGRLDPVIPPVDVDAIRAAHPDLTIHMYDAGHAFVAPSGHHPDSARLSLLRTLQLFARNGGGRGDV